MYDKNTWLLTRCVRSESLRRRGSGRRPEQLQRPIEEPLSVDRRYLTTTSTGGAARSKMASHRCTIPLAEVKRFVVDVMKTAGTSEHHAAALADLMVSADYRGHFSHGLNRLDYYLKDVRGGVCDPAAEPTIERQTAATALVDGHNGLGSVVGNFCTDLAIQKARQSGIGWVVAHGSNHYGIAGWYALRCADAGLVGMSFTNTSPLVVPTRGRQPMLGTNPIACAAPAQRDGEQFCLDMATCTAALGKIELQRRKCEPIPEGWGTDTAGEITTDPDAVKGLLPLGGDEAHSGYKGYGLAMMVELFCGLLSGSHYGPHVRRWENQLQPANLSHCFVALDPTVFADGFSGRLQDLMDRCRSTESAEPDLPVLVAGDPERAHMQRVDADGGVTYHENQLSASERLAIELGVTPMQAV